MLGKPVILIVDIETTGPLKTTTPGNYQVIHDENGSDTVVRAPNHEIIELGIVRLDE